jgi:ABC-type dipeptide/oligopeptide/nickel transport system permease component
MEIAAIVIGFIVGIAMGIYLATQIEQWIDRNSK